MRIALTNMGPTPLRAEAVEQVLRAGDDDPAALLAEALTRRPTRARAPSSARISPA